MSSESWQLSGDSAALYEKYLYPLMLPWVQALVEQANLNKDDRVLDVACGTGFTSRLAAEKVGSSGKVVGTDLNKGMLAKAREISEADNNSSIEWYEADITDMPFEDVSFDIVVCQQGMQFFPDIAAALSEIHRVLGPKGRLIFTIWSPITENPYLDAIARALELHLSQQAADGLRGALAKSYAKDFEQPFKNSGFHVTDVDEPVLDIHMPPLDEQLPGHLAAFPFADAIAVLPEAKRTAIFEDVSAALHSYVNKSGLQIPSRSEIISASKSLA